MLRRLTRHPATQATIAWLLASYLALVYRTTRWTLLGQENMQAALAHSESRSFVLAFWHERLPMMPMLWLRARVLEPRLAGIRAHVLVSRHRDGSLIGRVIGWFKLDVVHASTNRGGAAGMRVLLRLLQDGDIVAITPDGPRGPRRQAAPGVAQLAAVAGLPVLPSAARSSRVRVLDSWDRMVLPLPFGRAVLVVGPPILVPRADAAAALPAIEAGLNAACAAADAAVAPGPGR